MDAQRLVSKALVTVAIAGGAFVMATIGTGCQARGIGDPCVPEAVPGETTDAQGNPVVGFSPKEIYVESSSLQCRTRTCMVFRLRGDPTLVDNETRDTAGNLVCPGALGCTSQSEPITSDRSLDRVFCTCRCSAPGGANQPLCNCTDGFHCVEVLTAGGEGVRGGYCVPNDLCGSPTDCGEGRTCSSDGLCVML